jgi:glycosyltransferase involved in cell wall biosynthesis
MIIIDDGSMDRTPEVVASYRNKRIRYFRQKHVGVWRLFETYNKALNLARGKLIAILEGDDYWAPYKLEKQVQTFRNKNVVFAFGKIMIVNEEGRKLGPWPKEDFSKDVWQNRQNKPILKKLLFGNFIPSQTVICRKDSLMQIGGFKQPPGTPLIDYQTWLELSLMGEFSATNDILGYWRRYSTQVTQTTDAVRVQKALNEFRERFFGEIPPKIKDKLGIRMETLRAENQRQLGRAYLDVGRINLLKQNWGEARQNFVSALKGGSLPTKLKALLGLGLGFARKDFELIAKVTSRPRLR